MDGGRCRLISELRHCTVVWNHHHTHTPLEWAFLMVHSRFSSRFPVFDDSLEFESARVDVDMALFKHSNASQNRHPVSAAVPMANRPACRRNRTQNDRQGACHAEQAIFFSSPTSDLRIYDSYMQFIHGSYST